MLYNHLDHSRFSEFLHQGSYGRSNDILIKFCRQLHTASVFYYQTVTLPMGHGITWLRCSDGLYDMINSARIIDILSGDATAESKVKALIDVANRAGGRDNVTVVLVEDTTPATSDTANVMQAYSTYASSGYTHCAAIFQFLI